MVAIPIDEVHRTLEQLSAQWEEFVKNQKPGVGILARATRRCQAQHDYGHLSVSISHGINRLRKDWDIIAMLGECVSVGKLLAMKSLIRKCGDVADEVLLELYRFVPLINQCLKEPRDILNLIGELQRKTDELCNSEIRGTLEGFGLDIAVKSSIGFESFSWFVLVLIDNLQLMRDSESSIGIVSGNLHLVRDELRWMHRYLKAILKDELPWVPEYLKSSPLAFLRHAQSLALRIAFQSCKLWFNRTDPEAARAAAAAILDLHREIEPSNLRFLWLAMGFQQSLYKFNPETAFVAHLCRYILLDNGEDLSREMNSLITLYFRSKLDGNSEDVQSLFIEILAVIAEAVYFSRRVIPEEVGCVISLTKICLLKAEFFLKEQLDSDINMLFIKVNRVSTTLRAISEYSQGNTFVQESVELAEEIAEEMDSLKKSLRLKSIDRTMVKLSFLQWLFKIAFLKSEFFLIHISESRLSPYVNLSINHHEKDQINAIIVYLNFFKRVVMNKLASDSSTEEVIIGRIEAIVRDITLFSYSFLPEHERYLRIWHTFPRVLYKAKIVKAELSEIEQQFVTTIFPKISHLGFIGRSISEFLKHDPQSTAPVRHHIDEALACLETFKSFIMKVGDGDDEVGEIHELGNQVIKVTYKLEHVVQTIEAVGHLQQSLWLYHVLEDVRLLHQRVSEIHVISDARNQNPSPMMSPNVTAEINEMLIDLVDEEEAIVQRLTRGSAQRDVVSIVGMAGIGKTTLARKVFSNMTVTYYFHRRAWCTVSQTFSKRDLLLEIMSYMPFFTDEISQLSEDDLLHKLRQCLLGNKYLIVMDDVWDTAAWNDFSLCFPDDNNGSRILITSRLHDVASRIKPGCDPHIISLITDAQSWVILQKKIFEGAVCPKELIKIGVEIAQNCQGLPLAVVTIAGLLQKIEMSVESWKAVANRFSSEIIDNPENRCRKILEMSYRQLPEHLKACFLYFGAFLENKDIPAKKLMRYWMAEGLVQETDSKSLEEVAEQYLLELINRSLVNVSKKRSNGKARTCRLHDLLRDLCHIKAKEENFLQAVTINDEPNSSYLESDYEFEFDSMNDPKFESYRLSFLLKRQYFIDSRPLGLGVRSLTFFASVDMEPKCPYDVSFICQNFKLLRILDLEHIMTGHFPVEIGLMIQLRYLAVSGYMQSIPASIANLWRLETLVVKGLRGKVLLPETIWKMVALKHLHVNNHVIFSVNDLDEQLGSSCLLPNLISFSTPSLSCGENTFGILRRLPKLERLRCNLVHSKHCSGECKGFPVLEFLTRLESLKIIYKGRAIDSREFISLPSNLKKLTLSNFSLFENHLSMIGKLPNLRILKLLVASFEKQTWVMKEDEFTKLTFLELDSVNIVEWDASYEHLPSLERLVLWKCKDLMVIPFDFASITTLKSIEVLWCGQSVVESAQQIRDAEEDIEVLITRS